MNVRIGISRLLIRLGAFIQSLPIVIMKPTDLIDFGRQTYSRTNKVLSWSEDYLVESGLGSFELGLLSSIKHTVGNLLLLGVGGGREGIHFAKMGYKVTGVDFVPAMVYKAIQNAVDRGVHLQGLIQEISEFALIGEYYDVVWISKDMYSFIPTRTRRVKMLKKIKQAIKPGGELICQFKIGADLQNIGKEERIRQVISKSPFGNRDYELGDILWLNIEFLHLFESEDDIRSEIEEGGFIIKRIIINKDYYNGGVICEKPI